MIKHIRNLTTAIGAAALALCSTLALAHHSAAQFDFGQRVTIHGKVKEFNVTNPHTAAFVELSDAKGTRTVEYEGHSASHFYRAEIGRAHV